MSPNAGLPIDDAEDILLKGHQGSDPTIVDELLTKQLLSLSVNDRNDIQEEIHGVKCLAVEETPELIKTSLEQLATELENIPDSEKLSYLRSKQRPQSLTSEAKPHKIYEAERIDITKKQETEQENSYIHQPEFQLRFLRSDCFDIERAARRLVKYVDLLAELFGEYALWRPIRLSDFTKEEMRHIRKGLVQLLPYRDRSGRRIIVFFPQTEISPFTKAKITMYNSWVAGYNDVLTQRRGLVVVVWYDAAFAKDATWKIKHKFYEMVSTRLCAIHVCSPDTPYYRFRRSLTTMRVGAEYRSKLNFHLGESVEILYKLQGYGIPIDHVPISWTGKVKVNYLKQWMRTRQAIEHHNDQIRMGCSDGSDASSEPSDSTVIECPRIDDVVFRQGTSGTCHPGNVTFRSLIELILLETEQEYRTKLKEHKEKGGKKVKIKRPKQLALDIFTEQHSRNSEGRFLIWNNEYGWWNEIIEREQILMKIEYMVREFQKLNNTKGPSRQGSRKENRSLTRSNDSRCIQLNLKSDTNMFRFGMEGIGGGTNNGVCAFQRTSFGENKRQKLSGFLSRSDESLDGYGIAGFRKCFGLNFMPSVE